jgi:predicted acetyltransferase
MLNLVYPTTNHKTMWLDLMKEWNETGEKIIPYALSYRQDSFEVFLTKTEESRNNINQGSYIPATTYFLIEDAVERIIGAVNIRHNLNEDLLLRGGHIGYGIRPSERHKGYGTDQLRLALGKCQEMGIKNVLVTCDKENAASFKTIIKNGGILENEITEENGNIVQRYWIDISDID